MKFTNAYIKQLRTDARRLEAIARHLRTLAKEEIRLLKAEQQRATFFHKVTKADPTQSFEQDFDPPIDNDDFS